MGKIIKRKVRGKMFNYYLRTLEDDLLDIINGKELTTLEDDLLDIINNNLC